MASMHHRDCIGICRTGGCHPIGLGHRGKHLAVICQEGVVIMPSSPSDNRWRHNALAFVRRLAKV